MNPCVFVAKYFLNKMHKAGFVNIIGNPNVGKSTLMNCFLGEKLSIVTPKAQTTRHRIMGILNDENYQVVFSDTPGIINPKYKLQEQMMHFIELALEDADIFILISEIHETFEHNKILETLEKSGLPVIVLLNKIDLSKQDEVIAKSEAWKKQFPNWYVLPLSALQGYNISMVLDKIIELLPEHPPYFPKDQVSDKPVRFFISETIREKILFNYKKEVPYSVEVTVESYKETEELISIRSIIYVARDSQKAILIGHQGKALKNIGTQARQELENFLEKQVFLELHVKVSKNWRENESKLRNFGYIQK